MCYNYTEILKPTEFIKTLRILKVFSITIYYFILDFWNV